MKKIVLILALITNAAVANVSIEHLPDQRLVLVARGDRGTIEAFDDRFGSPAWSTEGLAMPRLSAVSASGSLAAFADPMANEVAIVSSKSRRAHRHTVPQTPVALRFIGESLYVLSRDQPKLTRIDDEEVQSVEVPGSPTHLAQSDRTLLVYSGPEGMLTEFDIALRQMRRTASVPRYGSDLEADATHAYLIFPRSGKMSVIGLRELQQINEFTVGAVPVDMLLRGDANVISAGAVSVADPSSKRVWDVERAQSAGEAFGRGFLRGLLGLGLYSADSSEFPTGIDRVWSAGGKTLAFDSSSGKLYQMVRGKGRLLVQTESPRAVAVVADRLALWNAEQKALQFLPLK